MKVEQLDAVLVPLGLVVLAVYHIWLAITIKRNPRHTVIGLNTETHHQWVFSLMTDPLKNGTLAVQTLLNNMMAATLLATTSITLSSIIGVFTSKTSSSVIHTSSILVYGSTSPLVSSVKYFTLILCFLTAFLCNVQSLRYYAHVNFLVTLPTSQGKIQAMEYATESLNKASLFWSIGLRAFYVAFVLFLWVFGPIPMFVCSCLMCIGLYFLDTTDSLTRKLHHMSLKMK